MGQVDVASLYDDGTIEDKVGVVEDDEAVVVVSRNCLSLPPSRATRVVTCLRFRMLQVVMCSSGYQAGSTSRVYSVLHRFSFRLDGVPKVSASLG